MMFDLESSPVFDFITTAGDGSVSDADSLPTAEVFEDATDTTVAALTVTKRTNKTGNYRVPVPCTTANGFELGKTYNVVVSATVSGVSSKGVVATFQLRVPRLRCTVVSDAGNSATVIKTDLSSSTNNVLKDMLAVLATGTLAPQVKKVTAYNGTTKVVTVQDGFTGTPSAGDVVEFINQ